MMRDDFYIRGPGEAYELLDAAGLPRGFCVMPWTHMMAKHTGTVKPCCLWPDSPQQHGFPLRIDGDLDIDEVMNGPEYAGLRRVFSEGTMPDACSSCQRSEAAGVHSYRTRRILRYSGAELREMADQGMGFSAIQPRLHWFDFRMSNICNLKCRMCFPHGSSRIEQEYVELGWTLPPRMDDDTARQWFEQFASRIGEARNIYFAGGEPLMMDTHWQILDRLIEAGNTDLALTYSTNLTQMSYRKRSIFDAWNRFSDVYVTLSVDHVGRGAEYIRHGTSWDQWLRNFDALRERCPHVKYRVATTVTVLNIMDLPDICEELLRIGATHDGNSHELFPADHPEHLSTRSMPSLLKRSCSNRMRSWCRHPPIGLPADLVPGMLSILDYMHAEDTFDQHGRQMLEMMGVLDRSRGEDIGAVFPSLVAAYREAIHG